MRIVFDTNVALSAFLWCGTPHQLLATIQQRNDIQLYASLALIEELADVLSRSFATRRLIQINTTAQEILNNYTKVIELIEPKTVPRVVAGDIDDDQVIAAAVAAQANLLVSGDRKHLLPLVYHQGIHIVDAAKALDLIHAM